MPKMIDRVISGIRSSERLAKLELFTRVYTNPNLSLTHLAVIKVRVLAELVVRKGLERNRHGALRETHTLRNSRKNRSGLVIANAPSVKRLNFAEVKGQMAKDKLDVFTVNYFPLSPACDLGDFPYFLVLSDPGTRPDSLNEKTKSLWRHIEKHSNIRVIIPSAWSELAELNGLTERLWFFDDTSLEGWSKNISPQKPRGYSSLTAFKALAFALHLGYEELFVIGLDNTMYQTLTVNEDNRIGQLENHAKGSSSERIHFMDGEWSSGVTDYFYDVSKTFSELKRVFGKFNIKNLNRDSIVDAFPKVDPDHPLLIGELLK
jgi:hypothetical protein